MKKITSAIALTIAASTAQADTIFGVHANAGAWQPEISGDVGVDQVDTDELAFADENATVLQLAVEHPVPGLPNIMVGQTALSTDGTSTLSQDYMFGDETFTADTEVNTEIDLTHTDLTLYYEVLDNWVNLDIGFAARQYKGELYVESVDLAESELIELDGVLPMAYLMARFDLPLTGLSLIAQGSGIGYNGDTLTDATAKLRWDFVPAIDFAIEAGYRAMSLKTEELDVLNANIDVSGPYIGLSLHL
ncbi:TIGR04219 family outer membrane beta-barrel protein [Biformimicrobium ophioploci]|uniref:TIGR04219 family outer membrane beta-barrel protein n=1 Tax=Biformimicrobium ophioploci TaxID=3036711 RepID=A0ABQ6LZJ8_9GAMM|nr:TIGR04219 family outer membrane beta-barrel protein [Microbulbifer sp. NKW57]GMG87455.1 TIGR04219 family outer membrane beta-barrel protein [Microbulbifer sp. NKW57]